MRFTQIILVLVTIFIIFSCSGPNDYTEEKACPQKIASLSLASDEILLDIIEDQRIIGITYLANNKNLSNVYEKSGAVPNRLRPNLEQIINLKPDIVVVADFVDSSFLHRIEKSGIKTHHLKDLNSLESIRKNIASLGDAVCERKKTDELISEMDKRIKEVKKREITNKPKIIYLFPSFFTAGRNTSIDDLIRTAGGVNLGAQAGIKGNGKISREYILTVDPDIIIVGSYSPDKENFLEAIKTDKLLQNLKAIKNGNTYTIETSHLTTVSHHIVKGIEYLASIIDNYNSHLNEDKTKTVN